MNLFSTSLSIGISLIGIIIVLSLWFDTENFISVLLGSIIGYTTGFILSAELGRRIAPINLPLSIVAFCLMTLIIGLFLGTIINKALTHFLETWN